MNKLIKVPASFSIAIATILTALTSNIAAGEISLELASPFADGAVLQRGMEVPVWGWSGPGDKVTVTFAGQSKTATVDAKGKWMVKLHPLTASADERDLTVSAAAGGTISRHGLLVGEVWFASGQSNMDWTASKSACGKIAGELQHSKVDVPVREYEVDAGSSIFPRSRATSKEGWKHSKNAGSFSAIALAFAWDLHQELKVPIGIIRCTHGATQIETWVPYEGFADQPQLQDIVRTIHQSDPTTAEGRDAFAKYYEDLKKWQLESEKLVNRGGAALPRPKLPGISDDWKGAGRMYNKKIAPLIPYAIRGAVWCQGEHNAGDGKLYAAKLEALINGWRKNWGRPELPFYFTQMQSYGEPGADNVGFADIREAQTLFFMKAKNVGMVPMYDLNPAAPGAIHFFNKLDPGKRLARWALAHEYGKDIAYTGPIYQSQRIDGSKVHVQFEQRGPGGGLMVGSKGMEADGKKDPSTYVEPARETKGAALKHFRLAGKDKVWHEAEAVIDGNEVVVTSKAVPEPVGVEYAYSASPIGANLYNTAGLPALPFAYFDGKQLFQDKKSVVEVTEDDETEKPAVKKPFLALATLFRNHVILQRDQPIPVWGHAVPKTEITVAFGEQTKQCKAGEFGQWLVKLDPMPASSAGRDLQISYSNDQKRIIKDVLIGDVWFLTGSKELPSEIIKADKDGSNTAKALPLVREFRIKAKTRRFRTPRKMQMEIGSGKYMSSWQDMDFHDSTELPSVAAYNFATQVQQPGVPVGIVTLGAENPPLTWISFDAMQTAAGFEKERDELNLAYPNTDICKKAVVHYIETVKKHQGDIAKMLAKDNELPDELAEHAPGFPQPYYSEWASRTETATHTYNFCISPLTPCAVRGVVWIPSKDNLTGDISRYSPSLKAYAESLAETYGQPKVPFVYAQPSDKLAPGIGKPEIANAASIELTEWPKNLKETATKLGAAAAGNFK